MNALTEGDTLLVGEGDFSFTVSLQRQLNRNNITSTSLLSKQQVLSVHRNTADNLQILERCGVEVLFDVDATRLTAVKRLQDRKFHFIIFNFPHIGGKSNIKRNRKLLKDFFHSVIDVLEEEGSVFVTLCQGQGGTPADNPVRVWADTWQVVTAAADSHMVLADIYKFCCEDYPEYASTGYRGQDRHFLTQDALTYIFKKCSPCPMPETRNIIEPKLVDRKGHKFYTYHYLAHKLNRNLLSDYYHPVNNVCRKIVSRLGSHTTLSLTQIPSVLLVDKSLQRSRIRDCDTGQNVGQIKEKMVRESDMCCQNQTTSFNHYDSSDSRQTYAEYDKQPARIETTSNKTQSETKTKHSTTMDNLSDTCQCTNHRMEDYQSNVEKLKTSDVTGCCHVTGTRDLYESITHMDSTLAMAGDSELKHKITNTSDMATLRNFETHTNNMTCENYKKVKRSREPINDIDQAKYGSHCYNGESQHSNSANSLTGELHSNPLEDLTAILDMTTSDQCLYTMVAEACREGSIKPNTLPVQHELILFTKSSEIDIPRFRSLVQQCIAELLHGFQIEMSWSENPVPECYQAYLKKTQTSVLMVNWESVNEAKNVSCNQVPSVGKMRPPETCPNSVKCSGPVAVIGKLQHHIYDVIYDFIICFINLDRMTQIACDINDIRLLWSDESYVRQQFVTMATEGEQYISVSLYPAVWRHDISFWQNRDTDFDESRLYWILRNVAGNAMKEVILMNVWSEPETGNVSRCYRIIYQSPDLAISREKARELQESVRNCVSKELGVVLR